MLCKQSKLQQKNTNELSLPLTTLSGYKKTRIVYILNKSACTYCNTSSKCARRVITSLSVLASK